VKKVRKNLMIIILFIVFILIEPINIETKKEETENNIEFLPQAMGVYEKWNFTSGAAITAHPNVADLDKDGKMEVIVPSADYTLYCLDSSGSVNWTYYFVVEPFYLYHSVIADFTNNSFMEIAIGIDVPIPPTGDIIWLSHTGNYLLREDTSLTLSPPVAADIDDDNKLEIIVGFEGYVLSWDDSQGVDSATIYPLANNVHSHPAVGDLDDDGKMEIIASALDGQIYCWNATTGTLLWDYTTTLEPKNGIILQEIMLMHHLLLQI
jgi:outer membrane protein assembly factor BamB